MKLASIRQNYPSQSWKQYFDRTVHAGILAQAGIAAGTSFAEPFEVSQLRLQLLSDVGLSIAPRGSKDTFELAAESVTKFVCQVNAIHLGLVIAHRSGA